MYIDEGQVKAILSNLELVKQEQVQILNELEDIILVSLNASWECDAQRKYAQVFTVLRDESLSQINQMIEIFNTLLWQIEKGFQDADLQLVNALG